MKLTHSKIFAHAVVVAAAASYVGIAAFGETIALGSLTLSLAMLAVMAADGRLARDRRRRLDLALTVGAAATLLPMCRQIPVLAAAGISLAASGVVVLLLDRVRQAQPDRRSQSGFAALEVAVGTGGLAPLLFESLPILVVIPPAATLFGVLRCTRPLSSDPSVFGRSAPSLFAAFACAAALLTPAPGWPVLLGAASCAALLFAHGAEIELRRTQEAAESSRRRARLRSLIENIDEAICASDLSGDMTFVNRRFLRLFGLQATFGGRFADLLHSNDVASFERQLQLCIESGRPIGGMRYKARRSDGQQIPVECLVALVEVGGIRIGLQATLRDISNQRLIEDSQRALAQRLEFFLDSMPLGCIVWDVDFRVQEWNPSAERIFGWSQLEVLGRRYEEILSTTGRDPVLEAWPDLLQGRQADRKACRNRSKGGESLDCEWFHTALLDSNGQVVAVASMVQDLSERRRLEEQLREAQKLEAVGTLAGGVAHDFNNLLTIILGNVAMSRMRLGPDHVAVSSLADAQTAAERAADLVRQLLSFSRRRSGDLEHTQIGASLSETGRLFQHGLGADILFDIAISEGLAPLRANSGQLGQLVMNLLVNAHDAVGDGGHVRLRAENAVLTEVECRARPWARPGDFVVISVSDDGPGMHEATKARIFEPFFTTKEVGKGTGLGLAVAYGIVQNHGGGIEVESQPGAGATFRVYLPAVRAGETSEAALRLPTKTGARVLLLETDPALRAVCCSALRAEGFLVLEAANDTEALRQIRADGDSLDLAVIDVTVPGRAGWVVWVDMRRLQPTLPVILTGSQPWIGDSLPAETFLPKPFEAHALLDAITERLCIGQASPV